MSKNLKPLSSFAFLNMTQFLGALNDNIFKFLVVFMAINILGKENSSWVTMWAGAIFVIPFLLFSIPSGTLADRYSKRNITIFTKFLEIVAMALGAVAFAFQSVAAGYAVLFLMAAQSAIFGPSKYGIVPELVEKRDISRANGILTAFTVLAIIFGTTLATTLTSFSGHNFILTGIFCVMVAILGTATSFGIEKTPAVGARRKMTVRIASEALRVLMRARTENYLFGAILGTSYFYLVGSYIQLNMIPFAIDSLGLSDVQGGYLFLVTALGIALGSFLAGRISGDYVELGISILSSLFLATTFLLVYLVQFHLIWVVIVLFAMGAFGGVFLVPFDAYIQAASPDRQRGENVAASNFISFVGILIASGLIGLFNIVFGWRPATGMLVFAFVTVLVTALFTYRMSDTLVRLASRCFFSVKRHGAIQHVALLGKELPCLVLCEVQHWWVGWIVMITLHQRYMRFAIERPPNLGFWTRVALRIGMVELYDGLPTTRKEILQRWLKRGYSVSIIPAPGKPQAELAECARQIREGYRSDLILARLETPPKPKLRHLEVSGSLWHAVA
jgi:acyl-[acyl-carrier-protein]-phospholipid O-acyltransferase / long-chain-fatty-acid--[acyl-carrier-protein] ligase